MTMLDTLLTSDRLPVALCLDDVDLPPQLQASLERHKANLLRLYWQLSAIGAREAVIEDTLSAMIASYRDELLTLIRHLKGSDLE